MTGQRQDVLAATLILSIVLTSTASAATSEVFRPDRDSFFSCKLHDYVKVSDTEAVPRAVVTLTPAMKDSVRGIFDVWEKYGDTDSRKLAYILATARRESAGTWQPVREAPSCGTDEACREKAIGNLLTKRAANSGHAVRLNYAKPAANGRRYYGRGYVQVTGQGNYRTIDVKLGLNGDESVETNPDRALNKNVAEIVLVRAVLEGWFGNRQPLSFSKEPSAADWRSARGNVSPHSPNKSITAASAQEIDYCLNGKVQHLTARKIKSS
jgi:hypothetical protein